MQRFLRLFFWSVVFWPAVLVMVPGMGKASEEDQTARLEERLRGHIDLLAGEIGERHYRNLPNLHAAAEAIKEFWGGLGFEVHTQVYEIDGTPYENVWVQIDGWENPEEMVLVGAHYDTVIGTPGADDNASGVGALLEISRMLRQAEAPRRSIRFAAFVNEEAPFFRTRHMGSKVYAREAAQREDRITAMISLESIGYFTSEPGSQKYPAFLGLFYPDEGNFLAIVGNFASWNLVRKVSKYFQEGTDFPSEYIAAPRWIPGVDWSDHGSFWDYGYQAVMVTDTALYRNPHYHRRSDRPETLHYPAYAKVVQGMAHVISRLADEPS